MQSIFAGPVPFVALLLALLAPVALAEFYGGSDVIALTPDNFDQITKSEMVLVEFYAPWCGHCKSAVPDVKKAATALKGVVKVAAVDADAHRDLGQRFAIQGFPTFKFLVDGKPVDMNGGRTAKELVDFALAQATAAVQARLGGRTSSSGTGGAGAGGAKAGGPSDVVELTDANFDELVLKPSDTVWMVEFFAPWCGHCKNLAPHWEKAATSLKTSNPAVKLGAVDATVHERLAGRYSIRGMNMRRRYSTRR